MDSTREDGWSALFSTAFRQSLNGMVLADADRIVLDVNAAYLRLVGYRRPDIVGRPLYHLVKDGPRMSAEEWRASLAAGQFTGEVEMLRADGGSVAVQWGATTELVTGRRLVLFVALSVSRWGRYFRRAEVPDPAPGTLSAREQQVVRLIARGASGPEIADELHISHETVRTHVRNAMTKLGTRSRAHLVAKAMGDGHALG